MPVPKMMAGEVCQWLEHLRCRSGESIGVTHFFLFFYSCDIAQPASGCVGKMTYNPLNKVRLNQMAMQCGEAWHMLSQSLSHL